MHPKIPKPYITAVKALYGTQEDLATLQALPARSLRHGQKNRPKRRIEQGLQIRLVEWLRSANVPVLSIPNHGVRSLAAGATEKAMGLWAGASDLFLPRRSANGRYPGYFIELKTPGEVPRKNQYEFMDKMRAEGYKAEWFDKLDEAKLAIEDYLYNVTA